MTPDFALNLSLDGISLLHRTKAGWAILGEVSLDDPDLARGLDQLRELAIAYGGPQFVTKVIVPNSQVLYAVLRADADEAAVREALKGRTALPLEDLAIDWQPAAAGRVRIAAVARDTLAEAAQFAADSGFHPVAQVASPFDEQYDGEAWFGPVAGAEALIARVGVPERGSKAVGTFWQKDAEVEVAAPVEPEPEQPSVAPSDQAPAKEDEPVSEVLYAPAPLPDSEAVADPETAAHRISLGEPEFYEGDTDLDEPETDDDEPDVPVVFAHRGSDLAENPPRLGSALADEVTEASIPRLGGAMPFEDAPPAFHPVDEPVAEFVPDAEPEPASEPEPVNAREAEPDLPSVPDDIEPEPARLIEAVPEPRPAPVAAKRGFVPPPVSRSPQPSSALNVEMPPALAKRLGVSTTPGGRSVAGAAPSSGFNPFGAKPRPVARRKSGATLAILMGGLVAAGAAFWIWAAFLPPVDGQIGQFGADEPIGDAQPLASDTAEGDVEAIDPSIEAEALADGEEVIADQPLPDEVAAAAADAVVDPSADPGTEPVADPAAALPADDTTLASETALASNPNANEAPSGESAENIRIAAIDPVVPETDAIALGAVSHDAPPGAQIPPLPPGTVLDLDERGLVRASAEGALSPLGILVFSGPAEVGPKPRPQSVIDAGIAAGVAVTPLTPETTPTGTVPDVPVSQEDNPLFEIKPRPRPGNLEETTERSALGGLTRSELAGFAPRGRPTEVRKVAPEPEVGEIAGNEYAPAISLLPVQKPGNIRAIAAAAVSTPVPSINADDAVTAALGTIAFEPAPERGTRQPEPEAETAAVASPDEEGDEAASDVAPSIPTSASVAKQATVKNAIDLGEITLIAVTGSSSNRRAIVRLANGKRVTVEVGDRLDGGKVVAIGDSELQYTKKSRTITLDMPRA
jgi:hypothetical protein